MAIAGLSLEDLYDTFFYQVAKDIKSIFAFGQMTSNGRVQNGRFFPSLPLDVTFQMQKYF